MKKSDLIIVRGAGDLATGTINRLKKSGFRLLVLETDYPAAIRRQVALSEAVYSKSACVEGVEAVRVVDAILAKHNLGTNKNMAPLTIALGPGFTAGVDVDVVIETKRGHNLGRVIREGSAYPNTGIPGIIGGYGAERVIHAPAEGLLKNKSKIGDIVEKGQVIAVIEASDKENESASDIKKTEVRATIDGLLRGLIRDNYPVTKGFKIADIDPRKEELANCFTISDKARCIAGSVLEVICEALE